MNEEVDQKESQEEEAQIWNLEVYEMPIADNRKKRKRKLKLHFILPFAALIAILLAVLTVKLQLPRRIALWHPTEAVIRKDVGRYLEERYEEKFVITNVIFPGFNYASYIITAYPEGKPRKSDYKVTVHGWEKKGLINYYDNYPVVKLIPELKEYISDVVGEFFPENKVYVQSLHHEWIRGNINKDFTLVDFLNDVEGEWHSAGWYHICVPYDGTDENVLLDQINKCASYMAENKLSGFFFMDVIYEGYYSLSDYYDDFTLEEFGKDFINYNYVISRYGNFEENKEVIKIGTK